jgi:CubicO group peptidase (beta-lactamase class C family)
LSAVKNQLESAAPASLAVLPISRLLAQEVIEAEVAPAATAGYARISGPSVVGAAGALPGRHAVSAETVFDLASVSKPIVACTVARLVAAGALELETPLGELLPEARGSRSEQVPLELLLAHRAGLEAHRSLFAPLFAARAVHRGRMLAVAARAQRPDCLDAPPPFGFAPVYSDLGYLLVGAALEAATNEPLDELVAREVTRPLGLDLGSARQLRRRSASFARRVAPTEVVRARGGSVRGAVHDENAWAFSGHAASGHAGLFGTVSDVLGFGQALLAVLGGQSAWLPRAVLERLVQPRPGGTLRAGFDGKSEGASSAGALAGRRTFGHLGFTGTSLWCDPEAGAATALLTNRVCPSRENPKIRAARPRVHDALFDAAKAGVARAPQPVTGSGPFIFPRE